MKQIIATKGNIQTKTPIGNTYVLIELLKLGYTLKMEQ